jgi:branched-chain amino acid aminotransferase
MPPKPEAIIHFEGRLVPASQALVPALSPAITRGPIVYETLRGYWSQAAGELFLFRMDAHIRRLRASMRTLRFIDIFEPEDLAARIVGVVRASGLKEDVHLRVFVYPTEQAAGGRVTTRSGIVIGVDPRPAAQPAPAACMVSSWRRPADDGQPGRIKAMGLRMFAWAAKAQAAEDGYDQLILLNDRGKVAEAVSSNLFLVRGGILTTPPASAGILEGVTRASILELARDDPAIASAERDVDWSELLDCEEAFLCSTGLEILPIGSIDRLALRPGPLTADIARRYRSALLGEDHRSTWRTPVYGS